MAEGAMTTFLSTVGEFFTQAVTWMGDIMDFVVQHPALIIMVFGLPLVGYSVGLLGRLFRL